MLASAGLLRAPGGGGGSDEEGDWLDCEPYNHTPAYRAASPALGVDMVKERGGGEERKGELDPEIVVISY